MTRPKLIVRKVQKEIDRLEKRARKFQDRAEGLKRSLAASIKAVAVPTVSEPPNATQGELL